MRELGLEGGAGPQQEASQRQLHAIIIAIGHEAWASQAPCSEARARKQAPAAAPRQRAEARAIAGSWSEELGPSQPASQPLATCT